MASLPELPSKIGGDTDILLGIKYLKYFPKKVFELENGLGIYESVFRGPDETRGILAGPHKEFSKGAQGAHMNKVAYFSTLTNDFNSMWKLGKDMPLLVEKVCPKMNDVEVSICCEVSDNSEPSMTQSESYCENDDVCKCVCMSMCRVCVTKEAPSLRKSLRTLKIPVLK